MAIWSSIDAVTVQNALTSNKSLTLLRVAKETWYQSIVFHIGLNFFVEAQTEDSNILSNTGPFETWLSPNQDIFGTTQVIQRYYCNTSNNTMYNKEVVEDKCDFTSQDSIPF